MRGSLAERDPETYLEDQATAEAMDDAQRGSAGERRLDLHQPTRTSRQVPARPRPVHRPAAAYPEIPQTCAPATLLARHAVMHRAGPTDGAVTSRYSVPVQVDLCGCIYRGDGALLRYCAGTTPIHLHEEGPR